MAMTSPERDAVERARAAYVADGYTVSVQERLEPLGDFRADAVARRGNETVVIEVCSAGLADWERERIARLAEKVTTQDGWRVDIFTYESVTRRPVPKRDDVVRRIEEARRVADLSIEAAVMLIWSAVEGALLQFSGRRGLGSARAVSPRALILQLNIDGILTDSQADDLDDLALIRNDIAHGMRSTLPDQQRLERLAELALALAASHDDVASAEDMIEWFFTNYATPEEAALFYDKEEGDYFWLGAGPHDPADVLQDQFDTASESDIAEAVTVITRQGFDWARRDHL